MVPILSGGFSIQQFKAEYWQQKPCLIRGLVTNFNDPIDENDLAGLAQEQDVDSRIVSVDPMGNWQTTSGPFDDFEAVCIGHWTLLVQGTEHYFSDIDALMSAFDFIPYWRTDDVMISYSTQGAGVGAHVDLYDVFLIQGKGKRHWQVGNPDPTTTEFDNNGLRQVKDFIPVIDCITECGDVLYIPPGWPHKGQTIDDALTYSIGFRAPNNELLADILTEGLSNDIVDNERFTDAAPAHAGQAAEITPNELNALTSQLKQAIDSAAFARHLVLRLSDQELTPEPDERLRVDDVIEALTSASTLCRLEGLKPLYVVDSQPEQVIAINGEEFKCPRTCWETFFPLLNNYATELPLVIEDQQIARLAEVLLPICQSGYYWFE